MVMDAQKNPDYLRGLVAAVEDFRSAFTDLMECYLPDQVGPVGIAPSVWERDGVDEDLLKVRKARVSRAAGRASEVARITNLWIKVQGIGTVDPIAAWMTVIHPKSFLTPDDVLGACEQALGRLEALTAKAEAEAPPEVGAAGMHPLVWGAAGALWRDGHYKHAVAAAAQAVTNHVKALTGRNELAETSMLQEAFSDQPPQTGKPRLGWPGDRNDQTVKSMNAGLRQYAAGVQLTIRNPLTHGEDELTEQEGVERLSTLSLLAGWIDKCKLETAP
jgi:hypothetical protein